MLKYMLSHEQFPKTQKKKPHKMTNPNLLTDDPSQLLSQSKSRVKQIEEALRRNESEIHQPTQVTIEDFKTEDRILCETEINKPEDSML